MISIPYSRSLHLISHTFANGATVMAVSGTRVDSSWCKIGDMDEDSDTRALICGDIVFINELGDVHGVPWIVYRDLVGVLRICPIYKWNNISRDILQVVMEEVSNKRMSDDSIYRLIDAWVEL